MAGLVHLHFSLICQQAGPCNATVDADKEIGDRRWGRGERVALISALTAAERTFEIDHIQPWCARHTTDKRLRVVNARVVLGIRLHSVPRATRLPKPLHRRRGHSQYYPTRSTVAAMSTPVEAAGEDPSPPHRAAVVPRRTRVSLACQRCKHRKQKVGIPADASENRKVSDPPRSVRRAALVFEVSSSSDGLSLCEAYHAQAEPDKAIHQRVGRARRPARTSARKRRRRRRFS